MHTSRLIIARLAGYLSRLPFTLSLLAAMIIAGILTGTNLSQISAHWVNRLGFAPHDLVYIRWERLITSALITNGGLVFWEALLMVLFAVGLSELRFGWKPAALIFWGIHFSTLLGISLVIMIFRKFNSDPLTLVLASGRDVGPSVGYFACLGLVIASLRRPWNRIGGGLVWVILLLEILLPPTTGQDAALAFIANIAHAVGFPLGYLSRFIWDQKPRSKIFPAD
jgi:hypothetical protein